MTSNDRIGDLLRHPAFAGFAPLLLPWDGRAYDERMPPQLPTTSPATSIPDAGVIDRYREIRFPPPEGGIVTVVYPIVFSPGNGSQK